LNGIEPSFAKANDGFVAGRAPDAPTDGLFLIDLDVFEGPFDLLVTLILNEDVDLLEVHLAEIVLSYIERLEARGELDLEAATEFLILIAALLELKSRLMLPSEDDEGLDLDPREAAEELVARLLEYKRFRAASEWMHERLAAEQGYRYRAAPLPPELRRVTVAAAGKVYEPQRLTEAIVSLLRVPPPVDTSHMTRVTVSLERRLAHLRQLLRSRASFSFEDAVAGSDRMTEAVTLFALLELYKSGELVWRQRENFGPIEIMSKVES
jgi:segregation and condensation protein A